MLGAVIDPADGILFVTVLLLIAASAVLALAETSLVRMSKARSRALFDAHRRGARSLRRLVDDPEQFLPPVLLLVLLCQLVAATLVGVLAAHLFGTLGVAVATVFEVVVIFVLGESVPKSWAVRNADRAALLCAPVVTSIVRFPPVRLVAGALNGLAHVLTPGSTTASASAEITESELLAMADVAAADDAIEQDERELIRSIIEFGDTVVREVMVPRPDVTAIEAGTEVGPALERAIAAGFSRIPVYERSLDDVAGIAYTKDLVRALRSGLEHQAVRQLCRPAHYVPETKRVAPLLREMQREQFHLAIVVDEYGGTAGVVALEDLIEELVGEIVDEFDVDEPLIEPVSELEYRLSARMGVDEANELLNAELPADGFDTVGGLILHLLGHVPVTGESVEVAGHRLVAEQVQGRRIRSLSIARLDRRPFAEAHAEHESSDSAHR
jgi:putative hemolysin